MKRFLLVLAFLASVTPAFAQRPTSAIAHDLQLLVDELKTVPPPTPAVITAPPGVDLGKVVTTEIQLVAGATYPGFTATHALKISGTAGLSGRTTPALAGQLPRIAGQVFIPVGVTQVSFEGVEIQADSVQDVVVIEGSFVSLNHVLIHGLATGTKRGIAMNGANISLTNSSVYDFKLLQQDSQAVAGWNGPGPFLIDNNYLEGAGENVIFGGSDPSTPGLIPSDITITNNTLAKPLSWKGSKWQVKNLIELKNAQRVLVQHNLFQNSWAAAQEGYAVQLTIRNQSGACTWCIVANVELSENLFQHIGSFVNILGRDDTFLSGVMDTILIARNRVEDLNPSVWGGQGRGFLIQGGPANLQLVDNVLLQVGVKFNSFLAFDQPQWKLVGLVVSGNDFPEGAYGITDGSGQTTIGKAVLDFYAPGYQWPTNTVRKTNRPLADGNIKYPVGTILGS